jgi:thiamine-phosphate pyrophosphorylase
VALAAVAGGADSVQLRGPELSDRELFPLAIELSAKCRESGVLLVVNDRVEVAIACGAGGVHLGARDRPEDVRRLLPSSMLLGITVEAPNQVAWAEDLGASYIGVTVWATPTKPEARPSGSG